MADSVQVGATRLRFSVRALLVLMFIVAMGLWGWREAYERSHSISLTDAVAAFNGSAKESDVGKYEPPLTEDEVVNAIKKQLPLVDASPEMNAAFKRIVNRSRLPLGAYFDDIPAYQDGNTRPKLVWWINLYMTTGVHTGYGLRIRENNSPLAARIFPGGAPPTRQDILQWTPPPQAAAGKKLKTYFD